MTALYVLFLGLGCTQGPEKMPNEGHADQSAVGSAAQSILSAEDGDLVIEIDGVDGTIAGNETLAVVYQVLRPHMRLSSNPERVNSDSIPAETASGWTINDVRDIESEYRQSAPLDDDGNRSIYMVFLDGTHAEENVLAQAYSGTSMVVYGDQIASLCASEKRWIEDPEIKAGFCGALMGASIIHEFGHLFGLVDIGTPMSTPHADENSPGHCQSSECIMSPSNATTQLGEWLRLLETDSIQAIDLFDDDCKNDIIDAYFD